MEVYKAVLKMNGIWGKNVSFWIGCCFEKALGNMKNEIERDMKLMSKKN